MRLCANDSSEAANEFYSEYLRRLGKLIGVAEALKARTEDSAHVKAAKVEVKAFLLHSLENRAFACCEWQKVVQFLAREDAKYLRGQR